MEKFNNFIQHKGLRENEVLPNSLESLIANYKGRVECDTFLLKDGNVAVLHERDLNLSKEQVEKLDLPALEEISVIPGDRKITPPLLKEFIGLAEDSGTNLALEIRSTTEEKSLILVQAIIKQFQDLDAAGGFSHDPKFVEEKVSFESFSVRVLNEIRKLALENNKDFKTALYWPSSEEWAAKVDVFNWDELDKISNKENLSWDELGVEVAARNGIGAIEFQAATITRPLVEKAHALGVKIGASITNEEELAKILVDLGVDYILTEKNLKI